MAIVFFFKLFCIQKIVGSRLNIEILILTDHFSLVTFEI